MSFLKSWAKSVYEKVVEDDYIQPLQTSTIYTIIQRTRSRKLSLKNSDDNDNTAQNYKDILQTLDRFALTSPDRELKKVGTDFSGISTRIKDLQEHLSQVQNIMLQSYNKYKKAVQQSLSLADCSQQIASTSRKSKELKQKLKNLQRTAKYIENVSLRNIKIKNIKSTLQYLKAIPNIKKISLSQLQIVKVDPSLSNKFNFLRNFDQFVDRQMTVQLKNVINFMKQCVTNFDSEKYSTAITDFMVIKHHQNITYQKLLLKIIETQIRNTSQLPLLQNLRFFLKIILNLHRICSWHRQNQQKVRSQFEQGPLASLSINEIQLNFQQCQETVQNLMDQSLAYIIPQKLMLSDLLETLQTLYLFNRFFEIGWKFSGKHYTNSVEEIHSFLQKKIKNTAKRALNELADNLLLQENNQWSRLPILNNYRHPGIQKSLAIIERYLKSQIYIQINKKNLCFIKKYKSEEQFIKAVNQEPQNQQDFQLKTLKLPSVQNIQLTSKSSVFIYQNEVVLCQSAVNMLKNIQIFTNFLFYYPIVKDYVIQIFCSIVEFYIHYLYAVFLSPGLKRYIEQDFNDFESTYTQLRIRSKYPNLYKHIRSTNKINSGSGSPKRDGKQSKKQEKVIIRSRVVSLQSGKFIISYVQSILKAIIGYENTKICYFKIILQQLNDFIYLDSIPKLCNVQNTQNLISGVRWNVDRDFESAISIMELIMKDFFNKLKAVGKGEIPQKIVHVLFAVYWKTQLTYIISRFLKDYKPGKKNKINFEQFLDQLYGKIKQLESDGILLQTYKRMKKIMPIIYERDIDKVLEMIKSLLSSYEFVIKVQMTIFRASDCVQGLTNKELESYQQYLLKWTQENCLN